jgi:transposase
MSAQTILLTEVAKPLPHHWRAISIPKLEYTGYAAEDLTAYKDELNESAWTLGTRYFNRRHVLGIELPTAEEFAGELFSWLDSVWQGPEDFKAVWSIAESVARGLLKKWTPAWITIRIERGKHHKWTENDLHRLRTDLAGATTRKAAKALGLSAATISRLRKKIATQATEVTEPTTALDLLKSLSRLTLAEIKALMHQHREAEPADPGSHLVNSAQNTVEAATWHRSNLFTASLILSILHVESGNTDKREKDELGRKCTCCEHPRHRELEEMLQKQVATSAVAEFFGVSVSSVYRHLRSHSRATVLVDTQITEDLAPQDLLMRLVDLLEATTRLRRAAASSGDLSAAARLVGIERGVIRQLMADLGVDDLSIATSVEEGQQLAHAVGSATTDDPRIGLNIAKKLVESDATSTLSNALLDHAQRSARALQEQPS